MERVAVEMQLAGSTYSENRLKERHGIVVDREEKLLDAVQKREAMATSLGEKEHSISLYQWHAYDKCQGRLAKVFERRQTAWLN